MGKRTPPASTSDKRNGWSARRLFTPDGSNLSNSPYARELYTPRRKSALSAIRKGGCATCQDKERLFQCKRRLLMSDKEEEAEPISVQASSTSKDPEFLTAEKKETLAEQA